MIEKFTSDGTFVRVAPEPAGMRLVADDQSSTGALLLPEEAAEIGLALLRWAADKLHHESPAMRVAIGGSLDRASRLIGTTIEHERRT